MRRFTSSQARKDKHAKGPAEGASRRSQLEMVVLLPRAP